MDAKGAERSRRYRAHKAGDHSMCLPDRDCRRGDVTVSQPVTRHAVTAPDLGTRGRRLWRQVTADGPELRPAEQVLLEEACRSADRLDHLDRILRGDEDAWLRFQALNDDGSIVRVVVNGVLAEVRQQQVALKALLGELRTSRGEKASPARRGQGGQPRTSGTGAQPAAVKGGGVVADLTSRIADRRQAAG